MEKEFMGTCVENPFDDIAILTDIVDNKAKPISKRTFLNNCIVHQDTLDLMKIFPNDYEYYKSGNIYFYTWSAIEHFYW